MNNDVKKWNKSKHTYEQKVNEQPVVEQQDKASFERATTKYWKFNNTTVEQARDYLTNNPSQIKVWANK